MFEYLQPADGPVIDGLESFEVVMAKSQPQYTPLRCVAARTQFGERLSRWTLTPEQRKAVADGADIFLELSTFHAPMNPIRIAVSDSPNPDWFRSQYKLPGESQSLIESHVGFLAEGFHRNSADEAFHAHLDICTQCRNSPFHLCAIGDTLIRGTR